VVGKAVRIAGTMISTNTLEVVATTTIYRKRMKKGGSTVG